MKNTRKILVNFAFYDRLRIKKKLEALALQGWKIQKMGGFLWTLQKIPPQKLHVEITYFPDASFYDPSPTEEQLQMMDFCACDGWELAATWGQMQVFYNSLPDPVPIETDPVPQVETIHRAMKKNMLFSHMILLAFALMQIGMNTHDLFHTPVRFLTSTVSLLMLPAWFLILTAIITELGYYFSWLHKARAAAENGVFLDITTRHIFSSVLVGASLLLVLFAFCDIGASFLLGILLILTVGLLNQFLVDHMKQKGVSRKKNIIISICFTLIAALVITNLLLWFILSSDPGKDSKPVGTYVRYGLERNVYAAPIPLRVEDLLDTGDTRWSTESGSESSFLASVTDYLQWPLSEEPLISDLQYSVVESRFPSLLAICKNSMVHRFRDEVDGEKVVHARHYQAIDAEPWGLDEVYQLYSEPFFRGKYLLCFDDKIVELDVPFDLTEKQMGIISEKLR